MCQCELSHNCKLAVTINVFFITPIVANKLQWKSTKFFIDGWMKNKCQHDITVIVANSNEKKSRHLEFMLQPIHWLHVFLVTVGHHFWPRLMAGAEIEQVIKKKKNAPPAHPHRPPPREKKPGPAMSACWAVPLAAWNFYFQNWASPFLGWANGRVSDLGT